MHPVKFTSFSLLRRTAKYSFLINSLPVRLRLWRTSKVGRRISRGGVSETSIR